MGFSFHKPVTLARGIDGSYIYGQFRIRWTEYGYIIDDGPVETFRSVDKAREYIDKNLKE